MKRLAFIITTFTYNDYLFKLLNGRFPQLFENHGALRRPPPLAMMAPSLLVDCHVHVWEQPGIWYPPDLPESGSSAARLLLEMNVAGVAVAAVVCTDHGANATNSAFVQQRAQESAGRLLVFPDVDSYWSPTYHQPGAAQRLHGLVGRFACVGITHYPDYRQPHYEWWETRDGDAFFAEAACHALVISLPIGPGGHVHLRRVAERYPAISFLCHHFGGIREMTDAKDHSRLKAILESALQPNIYLKFCGLHHLASRAAGRIPGPAWASVVRTLCEAYGPERLLWGSDFPVCTKAITYQQSLELVAETCPFWSDTQRRRVLGINAARLFQLKDMATSAPTPNCGG